MTDFIKLLNFEFNRFLKIYVILIIIIILSQLGGTLLSIWRHSASINDAIFNSGMTPERYILNNGKIAVIDVIYSYSFFIPIGIAATSLLLYVFFIWYRDWFSKNTFIYRLLMLPVNRMSLFWSKLSFIMLAVLGLVSIQMTLLKIENVLFETMIPAVYREDVFIRDIIVNVEYLNLIIPNSFIGFIIAYAIGLLFVTVAFTAILFERSFRLKGAIIGIVYAVLALVLFLSPYISLFLTGESHLYTGEFILIMSGLWLIIFVSSLFISRHLINKKLTV